MLVGLAQSCNHFIAGWGGAWEMYDRKDTQEHHRLCLALPIRLRFYRTLLSLTFVPLARKLMKQTQDAYTKVYPDDTAGHRMIAALLGNPLSMPDKVITECTLEILKCFCFGILHFGWGGSLHIRRHLTRCSVSMYQCIYVSLQKHNLF
jgi:hypothetical protein